MARRNSRPVMGGVFLVMGLLMALTALLDAARGVEGGVSATLFVPALLALLFFAGGIYLLANSRRRKRGR